MHAMLAEVHECFCFSWCTGRTLLHMLQTPELYSHLQRAGQVYKWLDDVWQIDTGLDRLVQSPQGLRQQCKWFMNLERSHGSSDPLQMLLNEQQWYHFRHILLILQYELNALEASLVVWDDQWQNTYDQYSSTSALVWSGTGTFSAISSSLLLVIR